MEADDLILVSVDDHICEPADMFEGRVPQKYAEFTPRVVADEKSQRWWYGDLPGRDLGLNAVAGKPREFYNVDACRYDDMRAGCYDVNERVRDMNAGGVLASMNFPNWTGFSGQVLNQGPDPDVNEAMIRAYNDWHVDEWCASYPDRFMPCGILPLFDVERAAAEVRRLADKGCRAVTFSENPEALKMPSIHSGEWDPLFAACCDTGTVLCCHLGSSSKTSMTTMDAPISIPVALSPTLTVFTLADLVWNDIWWRFPDLRFSLTEGDIGWIPFFLQRAEHVQEVQSGWTGHSFPDGTGPTDVFLQHVYVCFISDPVGLELIDHFNIDHVHWECDYPHSDSTWPNSPERVAEEFAGLTDSQVAKITHENAMRNFGFDPFARRPREECTVGALRAEATDVDVVTHVGREAEPGNFEGFRAVARAVPKG